MHILEMRKNILDKGRYDGAIFKDLSKNFVATYHGLMTGKSRTHGLSRDALVNMKGYLRVRENSHSSIWKNIITAVLQGSILRPLLFNIFINDLFHFVSNSHLSKYADTNTLYDFNYSLEEIKNTSRFDFG